MPEIGIADKITLDQVKTLIGANTDVAGTLTLFARLAQIAGYTDQVEGFVDALESNLGTTGDAANANGTVLARLAELLNNRLTAARAAKLDQITAWQSKQPNFIANKVASTTYTTLVNVTGSGILTGISGISNNGEKVYFRVYIDGVLKLDTDTLDFGFAPGQSGQYGQNNLSCIHRFNTSLLVQYKGSTTGTQQGFVSYLLD